jgi:class 3 adenylate cyclase
MALAETQLPERFRAVCQEQIDIYNKGRTVQVRNSIPDTNDIPLDDKRHWLRIPDVICVFVDMTNSTGLSAATHDRKTAGAYQLFTDAAVRLFDKFDAPYIDVRGDGVFALFNSGQAYRALASAVSFRTFVAEEFTPRLKTDTELELKSHVGIDRKTVLVKKLGMRKHGGRTDRQNEVWAGKPVNMAAKLASIGEPGHLLASERYYKTIPDDHARRSCGCREGRTTGEKTDLWTEVDVMEDARFDFDKAYRLTSCWCPTHGDQYCETLLGLDDE